MNVTKIELESNGTSKKAKIYTPIQNDPLIEHDVSRVRINDQPIDLGGSMVVEQASEFELLPGDRGNTIINIVIPNDV
jgi:hypothetical protein